MKILLAIDGSACSDLAVNEIARRPWPKGSVVRVLSVFEPITIATPEAVTIPQSYFDEIKRVTRDDISRAVLKINQEAGPEMKVEQMLCVGFPKQMILDEAEGWGADLIVVGSHGRGLMGRFLLGSVSQAVALNAKCSVEIVRCRRG